MSKKFHILTKKQKRTLITNAKCRKAAKARLLNKLQNNQWYNGEGKGSGHALKQDLHDGNYTAHYSRFVR